ncbi:ligand-binding sensor domain-containing diguanylate cyclase, partial [Kozakia baliensis]|uniref:ligand-binding sensor domain-containing diguanylate cyclase n=1 Tax=Kozakia baliensis TaxID=153496 RepID=UPI001C98ED47
TWTPKGKLLTQRDDGLMDWDGKNWRRLFLPEEQADFPIITSLLFDQSQTIWIGTLGQGLARTLNYNSVENWGKQDGLTNDLVWSFTRPAANSPLWIGTDAGVDRLDSRIERIVPFRSGTTYTLASDQQGNLWLPEGAEVVTRLDLKDNTEHRFRLVHLNQIVPGHSNDMWFLTRQGIFHSDNQNPEIGPRLLEDLPQPSITGIVDDDNILWATQGQKIVEFKAPNQLISKSSKCFAPFFEPDAIITRNHKEIWIGGTSGIYRLIHQGNSLLSCEEITLPKESGTNIVAMLHDKRDWIWAGTDRGLSLFANGRWYVFDTNAGLPSNDVSQGGLYQDEDGSIWVGTSHGLSHICNPKAFLEKEPIRIFVGSAKLGSLPIDGHILPYSRSPLTISFGFLNYRDDDHIRFRYKLDGFDENWEETTDGSVRYAKIDPGTYRFHLNAYNPWTQQSSSETSFIVQMAWPWWKTWTAYIFYGLILSICGYSIVRLRVRYLVRQKKILEEIISCQTAELAYRADHDRLTGLLNRAAIEDKLEKFTEEKNSNFYLSLFDVDHFKSVNDQYGHNVGDEVLVIISQHLKQYISEDYFIGRYGGEEFIIIVQKKDKDVVKNILKIRSEISQKAISLSVGTLCITLSAGIVQRKTNENWRDLILKADMALYQAKRTGRNRAVAISNEHTA